MIIADIPHLVLHESHRFCKCVRSIIALIVEHSYRWLVLFIFWLKGEKWHVNDEKVINLFELEFLFEDYYLYRKKNIYIIIKFINFTKTLEEAVVFFETRPSHWYWKAQNSERNRAEYLTRISTVLRAQRTIFWYSSSGRWYRRGIYNANSRGQYHSSTRPSRTRGEEFAREVCGLPSEIGGLLGHFALHLGVHRIRSRHRSATRVATHGEHGDTRLLW